jgi:hypothetical protein
MAADTPPRLVLATLYAIAATGPLSVFLTGAFTIQAGVVAGLGVLMIITLIATLVHNLLTVREPMTRAQALWLALGIAGPFAGAVLGIVLKMLLPSTGPVVDLLYSNLLVLLLPICLGVAITRYRLFDIDVIIRRTLVYSTLTLILGLIYLGSIVVLRSVLAPLIGSSEPAIVVSTLAIAALFTPLRHRIQNFIDRRFYRRKYDAAKVLAAFGVTARDETDLERLTGELVRVVDETMQPEFVGLWLRDTGTSGTPNNTSPRSRQTL